MQQGSNASDIEDMSWPEYFARIFQGINPEMLVPLAKDKTSLHPSTSRLGQRFTLDNTSQ